MIRFPLIDDAKTRHTSSAVVSRLKELGLVDMLRECSMVRVQQQREMEKDGPVSMTRRRLLYHTTRPRPSATSVTDLLGS